MPQQIKPVNGITRMQTRGERLVSALRRTLFTIPFSKPVRVKNTVKKKPVPVAAAKTAVPEKAVKIRRNPPVPAAVNVKPVPPRYMPPQEKAVPYLFTAANDREEFEKILFVLRACDKTGNAAFTKVLHVECTGNGSRLVATDGKRLHVAEIGTMIKPGDYKPVITKEVIKLGTPVPNAGFPDWMCAVPVNTVRNGCINPVNTAAGVNNRACGSFVKLSGEKVNPDYLADLTDKPWAVYTRKEKRKALLLKELGAVRETYAVIMPLSA